MRFLWYCLTFPGQLARFAALTAGSGALAELGSPTGVLMTSLGVYLLAYILLF